VLPDLLGQEPVAHQVARVDDELLPLLPLFLRELGVVLAQREAAERHVTRLVLHHVRVEGLGERLF